MCTNWKAGFSFWQALSLVSLQFLAPEESGDKTTILFCTFVYILMDPDPTIRLAWLATNMKFAGVNIYGQTSDAKISIG
jgi:hypothetical protein